MDDETFLKHYNARHLKDANMGTPLPQGMVWTRLSGLWRAFHKRCHELEVPGQYDHEHDWE